LNSTKLPTAGAVPLRTDTRTRSSLSLNRALSMRSRRTTIRSERSRSSRTSTKPANSTFHTGAARTGWAMISRLMLAAANPAATAAMPTVAGSANGRWRHTIAAATVAPSSSAAAHGAGSRSTAK